MEEQKKVPSLTVSLTGQTQWLVGVIEEIAEAEKLDKADLMRRCLMEGLSKRSESARVYYDAWKTLHGE